MVLGEKALQLYTAPLSDADALNSNTDFVWRIDSIVSDTGRPGKSEKGDSY